MNPISIILCLIGASGIALVIFQHVVIVSLDREEFLTVPSSEANRADVREYSRSLYREPTYPARRSIYEEPTSVN